MRHTLYKELYYRSCMKPIKQRTGHRHLVPSAQNTKKASHEYEQHPTLQDTQALMKCRSGGLDER